MSWIMKLAKQPSTWRGLTLIATASGVAINPAQTEAIVAAGLAVAGCLGAFLSD